MSRSYKHIPISKDDKRSKYRDKQIANRRARRKFNWKKIGSKEHSSYKKITCSYDINDYISYCTLNEHLEYRTFVINMVDNNHWLYKRNKDIYNINKQILHWKKWYYFK